MIIPINLTANTTALLGVGKILLPETVFLDFSSAIYPLDNLIVTVKKGGIVKQYKPQGKTIDITDFCNIAGLIEIEASITINCEPVKTWRVEPLILCEIEHTFAAIPEIEALKEELSLVKSAIADLANLFKNSEII